MPSVDLVIPSYGGPIEKTLDIVTMSRPPGHVYVIDNADRIGLTIPYPESLVTVIYPRRNIGWEAGLNVGTAMSDADYVIWMNDDVQPETKDWHLKLVEPMEEDPSIALVGPLVRGHNNFQGRLNTMLPDPHPLLWDLSPVYDDLMLDPENSPSPAFRISFFCVAVRRAAWHDIGPVDDRFSVPATGRRGGDDYDYSWRAELAGWDQVCRTDVWVNHVDQGQTYRMLGATKDNTPLLKEKWGWK
jgi:GT2 family glycosyltransferase